MSVLQRERRAVRSSLKSFVVLLILTVYSLGFLAIQAVYHFGSSDSIIANNIYSSLHDAYKEKGFLYHLMKYSYNHRFDNTFEGFFVAFGITFVLGLFTIASFNSMLSSQSRISKACEDAQHKSMVDELRQ